MTQVLQRLMLQAGSVTDYMCRYLADNCPNGGQMYQICECLRRECDWVDNARGVDLPGLGIGTMRAERVRNR